MIRPVSANAPADESSSSWDVARRSMHDDLPERYRAKLNHVFQSMIRDAVRPGMTILDIGAGRHPSIPLEDRPVGLHYIGLDISSKELELAPRGGYDEVIVADITSPTESLNGRVDLAISFQVFEHVTSLRTSLENVHTFLGPGGRLIAQFSGRRTVFGLANRMVPHAVTKAILKVALRKQPDKVFPAYYDHCWYDAIVGDLSDWTNPHVTTLHRGGTYFGFSRPMRAAYILCEEWILRTQRHNLATYYIVDACR